MPSEILINVRPVETRVAYIENGALIDLKIERKTSPTMVGSVHRGKVIRVLPGMQAAFVDIGLDRAAFLYVGDVRSDMDSDPAELFDSESVEEIIEPVEAEVQKPRIQELLTEGQQILVQVAKDPIGSKGARITTHISLPGRHVVFMPTVVHLGVSRRIADEQERDRLKEIVQKAQPNGGVIVRTAGEGASEANIIADLDYLNRLWQEIQKNYEKKRGPGAVHTELDVELRALRDLLNEDIERVVTDEEESYRKILNFLNQLSLIHHQF